MLWPRGPGGWGPAGEGKAHSLQSRAEQKGPPQMGFSRSQRSCLGHFCLIILWRGYKNPTSKVKAWWDLRPATFNWGTVGGLTPRTGASGWERAGGRESRRVLGWPLGLGAVVLGQVVRGGPRLGWVLTPAGCPSDPARFPSLQLPLFSLRPESSVGHQPKSGGHGEGEVMWVELTRLLCSPSYL